VRLRGAAETVSSFACPRLSRQRVKRLRRRRRRRRLRARWARGEARAPASSVGGLGGGWLRDGAADWVPGLWPTRPGGTR
jgi:hypothetical protein